MILLNDFDLTASLDAVRSTTYSREILTFVIPAVAAAALVWIAIRTNEILALLLALAIGFAVYGPLGGIDGLASQPVALLLGGDAILVALAFFLPERAKRSIYV